MRYYSVHIADRKQKTRFKGGRTKVYQTLHRKGYTYSRKYRRWADTSEERYVPVSRHYDEKNIKQEMMEQFYAWQQNNPNIGNKLVRLLSDAKLQNEGEDIYQLNTIIDTDLSKIKDNKLLKAQAKVRYDIKQSKIIFYIRGYEYEIK